MDDYARYWLVVMSVLTVLAAALSLLSHHAEPILGALFADAFLLLLVGGMWLAERDRF